jgi:hypothetical protein
VEFCTQQCLNLTGCTGFTYEGHWPSECRECSPACWFRGNPPSALEDDKYKLDWCEDDDDDSHQYDDDFPRNIRCGPEDGLYVNAHIPVPTPAHTPTMYSCNSATGQCKTDPEGSLSPGECIATCKSSPPTPVPTPTPTPVPTPAPTPTMYSCDSTTGQCKLDPEGSLSPGDCIVSCKCVVPHNCGQLNNTAACGAVLTHCNVCDMCCSPWITQQAAGFVNGDEGSILVSGKQV